MVGATRIIGGLCLAAIAAVMCVRPAVAEACSGPAHWFTVLSPQSEATEVPLNSVATLIYANSIQPTGTLNLELSADGMGPVEVDVIAEPWAHAWIYRVSVVPRQPLLAEHVYRLRAGETLLTRFTTGQGRDDAPPPPPSLVSVDASSLRLDATCGSYSVQAIDIRVASEEPVTYVVRAGGRLLAEQDQEHGCGQDCGVLGGDIVCGERRWSDTAGLRWELEPGSHLLQITARDSAGNESTPLEVEITADCPSGCSAAAHDGGWLAFAAVFALVGFPRRRSRRSLHAMGRWSEVALAALAAGASGCVGGGSGSGCLNQPRYTAELRLVVPGGGRVAAYVDEGSEPLLSCPGSSCFATIDVGRELRLEASASTGRTFTGWSDALGDSCVGTDSACAFSLETDVQLTASFGPPAVAWTETFGGAEAANLLVDLHARPDGLVVVGGALYDADAHVTRIDDSGATAWSVSLGAVHAWSAQTVFGGTLVGGRSVGTPRVGGIEVPSYGGGDAFVAHVDDAGGVSWARVLGGPGGESIRAVAGDAETAFAAGTYTEAFYANAQVAAAPEGRDVFVAVLDQAGTVTAMSVLGSPGDDTVIALARADDATLWLLVHSEGALRWEGGGLEGAGVALLRLSGADAAVIGGERLGGSVELTAYFPGALLPTASGELYVAVTFRGSIEIGEMSFQSVGPTDVVVARRAADDTYVWARQLGDSSENAIADLAVVGEELVGVGTFRGLSTLGGSETLRSTSPGSVDVLVVHLDRASGRTHGALHYGAFQGDSQGSAVIGLGDGGLAIGGGTSGLIDFGQGPVGRGLRTAFVTRFE